MKLAMIISTLGLSLFTSCSPHMTPHDLDSYLRKSPKQGFVFQSKPTANSWIVAFQGPGMKQIWSLIVAVSRAPGTGLGKRNGELDLVSIGTTVWRGKAEPSKETMSYLLQMNALDHNVGALSVFREKDEWFVQYFTRVPLRYMTKQWLEFSVGYVGGFADSVSEKLKGMK